MWVYSQWFRMSHNILVLYLTGYGSLNPLRADETKTTNMTNELISGAFAPISEVLNMRGNIGNYVMKTIVYYIASMFRHFE